MISGHIYSCRIYSCIPGPFYSLTYPESHRFERKYAQEKGYEVVGEYLDVGYSGATLDRTVLDRLRDAFSSGEFGLVLMHSLDRLVRRVVYQYLILEEVKKAGIRPEFLNCPVDDSPESSMLLGSYGGQGLSNPRASRWQEASAAPGPAPESLGCSGSGRWQVPVLPGLRGF